MSEWLQKRGVVSLLAFENKEVFPLCLIYDKELHQPEYVY